MKTVKLSPKNIRLTLSVTSPNHSSTTVKKYRSTPQPKGKEGYCCDMCDLQDEWVCSEVPCSPIYPPLSNNGDRLFKLVEVIEDKINDYL